MARKLAIVGIFVVLLSIMVSGMSSQAAYCKKVVITVMNSPIAPPPICYNYPQIQTPSR